jgi:hypothetical protein
VWLPSMSRAAWLDQRINAVDLDVAPHYFLSRIATSILIP